MRRSQLPAMAVASMLALAARAAAGGPPRVDGPYASGNLAVYLIHGDPAITAHGYLTLREGLASQKVVVHEVRQVNQLEVENTSDQDLFLQAGEIVKGGQQDRTLARDLVVSAHSGRVPIDAHCVEHGRWTQRGNEAVAQFSSSENMLATKDLKRANYAGDQSMVWEKVAQTQQQIAENQQAGNAMVAGSIARASPAPSARASHADREGGGSTTQPVADAADSIQLSTPDALVASASPTSLQLTLEQKSVQSAAAATVKGLPPMPADSADVVGFAFAVNGKLDGGDVYASHALLAKMYPKLLTAASLESVIERPASQSKADPSAPPSATALTDLIAAVDAAKPTPIEGNARVRMLVEQQRWANARSEGTASIRPPTAEPGQEANRVTRPAVTAAPAPTPLAPTADRAVAVSRSIPALDEYETRDTAAQEPFLHRTYLTK